MIPFFQALFRRRKTSAQTAEPVLKGVPARERWKNYAAENGYVYQYVYRGFRLFSHPPAQEFVFEIRESSVTRRTTVWILEVAASQVESELGRQLLYQERYAIAKMALFQGFDKIGSLPDTGLTPGAAEMLDFLKTLGRAS